MADHIKRLFPTGLGFSQAVIARGDRHIFLAGQCAMDRQGRLVGEGDLGAQTEQVMQNIEAGLKEAGASFDDVVPRTIYVVDYDPSKREIMQAVRGRYIPAEGGPASTLIGVSGLVHDAFLVEIEVQAIVRD
ncbi:MAG: translation initiation inhibitor [Gammaproteobacteria bacterium]|nr:translation initiation inhibitor [Gammaproteobacteria bacterium]